MWRELRKEQEKKTRANNSRLNIVAAFIFLLGFLAVWQLYKIQVNQHDLYSALASSQHQIYNKLRPERGQIFVNDRIMDSSETKLYPLATNKDYASLFAIPKDLADKKIAAENYYLVFKQKKIIEEVDKMFEEKDKNDLKNELNYVSSLDLKAEEKKAKKDEVNKRYQDRQKDSKWLEERKIEKELEIEKRKKIIVEEMINKLDKFNDPYESLEVKVDIPDLLTFYALMLTKEGSIITPEQLEFKEGRVRWLNPPQENNGNIAGEKVVDNIARIKGIDFTINRYRYYPEKEIGSHLMGFVSWANNGDGNGNYGLEEFFNDELRGQSGHIKSERAGSKSVMIVNDREYQKPISGEDLVLTVDRSVEFSVCQKLTEAAKKHEADSATAIVVEPKTGAIVAMCSYPEFDPNNYRDIEDIKYYNNPAIFYQYEPGSVFKVITMASAINEGKVTPDTTYNDEGKIMINGWPKPIRNSDFETHGPHGVVDMSTVLEFSLNTGAIFAMKQIGVTTFTDYVKKFGFGEKTGIELGPESGGDIRNLLREKVREVDAATASFGQGITSTPLQMVMAYAAVANGGILMKPYIVKEILHQDGTKVTVQPQQVRRVISEKTADLVKAMMVNVLEKGHTPKGQVKGYFVGGKTGTAQIADPSGGYYASRFNHTFIGIAPIDDPKFVILTKFENPKDVRFADSSAAPLFSDIADFLLKYYKIPKERE
ncbi:MAG: penicillin-binding protein 2 [Planctomycetes bacterium]|jgi:cell division protein FtsI/penicillin-binding protein 2|nr:penicillin-binding protein 2 [Planctomycetota bacterium]